MKHVWPVIFFCCMQCYAQPYTIRRYPVIKDSAVLVDWQLNYCGRPEAIRVNIYKPIGDKNNKRPVAIFAHGGSFTSTETADEENMNAFAEEFARRGYVAVSMDYREGFHLNTFAPGLPAPAAASEPILIAYSALDGGVFAAPFEYERAGYRAMQDMKGVIRWMKGRCRLDSTSTCQYFAGGFSAGAFMGLATAFTDVETEKPEAAQILTAASNPNWVNTSIQNPGPQNKDDADYRSHNPFPFNFDSIDCYLRPNLGSIDGAISMANGYDATVLGIMSLSGAISDTTLFNEFLQQPAIFLYHAQNDAVVPFDVGHPFRYLDIVFDPPPSAFAPIVYGSNWIWDKLNRIQYPALKKQIFYTGPAPPLSFYHGIFPNVLSIADSVARFFGHVLELKGNCQPDYTSEYIFNGNGTWDNAANWFGNRIPSSPVSAGVHIIIQPQQGGACIINVPVTLSTGAGISVVPGALLLLTGNLIIQ